MTYDFASLMFGMALGFPLYLLVDRLVYPFSGFLRGLCRGDE